MISNAVQLEAHEQNQYPTKQALLDGHLNSKAEVLYLNSYIILNRHSRSPREKDKIGASCTCFLSRQLR